MIEKISKLKEDVKRAEYRLHEAEDLHAKLKVGDSKAVATYLHETECRSNRVDGCSWAYEKDFSGSEKSRWLNKANKLIKICHENRIDIMLALEIREI